MRPSRLARNLTAGALAALSITAAIAPADARTGGLRLVRGDVSHRGDGVFHQPLRTDAAHFPLRPGTRFVYEGSVTGAVRSARHRVVFTVTDLVKTVGGVSARVILDEDFNGATLTEAELAFFAQDDAANVWTMGEYPEEFDGTTFTGAPSSWAAGVAKAQAGILVPGHPAPGTPQFVQGRAPSIDFYDVGKVIGVNAEVTVPAGAFSHVVVVDEHGPLAPEDGHQQKYYAPGVGLVAVAANSGDSRETLRLVAVQHLAGSPLASVRAQAVRLDQRAYRYARGVYGKTARAHRAG